MIQNTQDLYKTLRKDTDQPYDVYMKFLSEKNVDVSDCIVFDLFKKSTDKLVKAFGEKVIFLLTMKMLDDISFCVYVGNMSCEASSLEAIESYLAKLVD